MIGLKTLLKNKQANRLSYFIAGNFLVCLFMVYTSHSSKSLALASFTHLLLFDLLSLLTAMLSISVKFQPPSSSYPYGFKRCEVLAIFASTILTVLGSFFIIKEGVEILFEGREVFPGGIVPAATVGFLAHVFIIVGIRNEAFEYVIKSSPSNWLQEHMLDLSETACRIIPSLSKVLLPRVNPFILVGLINFVVVTGVFFLLQISSDLMIDTYAAVIVAIMTISTMLPFTVYTGKILLQTTPSHMITQLDKSLREASTLDGVLEFRDEHFWTVSLGVLAGSLHVRIRRDADEQLVLAHVWNKLAGMVQILTIHIFKDDWMRRTTHQLVYNQQQLIPPQGSFQLAPPAQLPQYGNLGHSASTGFIQPVHGQQAFQYPSSTNPSFEPNIRKSNTNSSLVDSEYVFVNP